MNHIRHEHSGDSRDQLEVCAACRELDQLWNELLGDDPLPSGSRDSPTADPSGWKEARGIGPILGERATSGKGSRKGPPPPNNCCPDCGRWKKAEYETCFACSGMVLCEDCGENYHHEEYDCCWECR